MAAPCWGLRRVQEILLPRSILIFRQHGLAWEGRGGGAGRVIFICLSLLCVQMPGWDYSVPSAFRQGHMGTTNSRSPLHSGVTGEQDTFPAGQAGASGRTSGAALSLGLGRGGAECRPPRTHQSPFHKRAGLPALQARDTCPTRELTLLSTPRCSHRVAHTD